MLKQLLEASDGIHLYVVLATNLLLVRRAKRFPPFPFVLHLLAHVSERSANVFVFCALASSYASLYARSSHLVAGRANAAVSVVSSIRQQVSFYDPDRSRSL